MTEKEIHEYTKRALNGMVDDLYENVGITDDDEVEEIVKAVVQEMVDLAITNR